MPTLKVGNMTQIAMEEAKHKAREAKREAAFAKRVARLRKDREYLTEEAAIWILERMDHTKRLGADGLVSVHYVLYRNIKERREAEEQVRNLRREVRSLKRKLKKQG